MTDLFKSPHQKVNRAKTHIQDLDRHFGEFANTKPYTVVEEPHPTDRGRSFHKLKLVAPIPAVVEDCVSDAISNLRAALDNVCYAAARARGMEGPKLVHFPFGGTLPEFERTVASRCKDIPEDILSLIRAFKPYKGGNDLLWALNRACNINKHELLVQVGHTVSGVTINSLKTGPAGHNQILPPKWDRVKNEMIFGIFSDVSKVEYDLDFSIDISFDDIEIIGGYSVLPILNKMADIVDKVVRVIEFRTRSPDSHD